MWLASAAVFSCVLIGCGGGGGSSPAPPPAATGDTTLFPNAELLMPVPALLSQPNVIILDARSSASAYTTGHIPGALHAPPQLFSVDAANQVLLPVNELEQILGNLGITRTSAIVIYDDTARSLGAGGRLFWLLEYLGCTNVSILNGGWDQWQIQRMPVQTTTPSPTPAVFTALVNNAIYVGKEFVSAHLNDPNGVLIDVRTDPEYRGEPVLENQSDPRLGHIPGAISFPYTRCYNADMTVLNKPDLEKLLVLNGITPAKTIVAYSTVGKRSAFFYYLLRLMDYTDIANYDGSIVDWGASDPILYPMVTGP